MKKIKKEICRYCKKNPAQMHGICKECCDCCNPLDEYTKNEIKEVKEKSWKKGYQQGIKDSKKNKKHG